MIVHPLRIIFSIVRILFFSFFFIIWLSMQLEMNNNVLLVPSFLNIFNNYQRTFFSEILNFLNKKKNKYLQNFSHKFTSYYCNRVKKNLILWNNIFFFEWWNWQIHLLISKALLLDSWKQIPRWRSLHKEKMLLVASENQNISSENSFLLYVANNPMLISFYPSRNLLFNTL
jgi:hypothetical protein